MSFGFKNTVGSGGGGGGTFPFGGNYANYSALPLQPSNPNKFFYCTNSQGTKWLPGSWGGTYYPNGWYYSDGASYTYQEMPFQADQLTTDAGVNYNQFITPLTLQNAAQLNYTNPLPSAITVGGIAAGTTFSMKKLSELFDLLLYPELFPTLINPSNTFVLAQSGLREIGEVVSILNFSATFNRGSISPSYGTNGYRSGLPNTYRYTGSGLSDFASTSLTDSKTVSNYVVLIGVQNWIGYISYDSGQQPLSSKGNNYSTALAAGNTGNVTVSIRGVYPWYYNSASLTISTKQSLAIMGSTVTCNFLAEDGVSKQFIELPNAWGNILTIQQYNTLSGFWDTILLSSFTKTSTTKTIQGNVVNYDIYTYNGSTIGSRIVRFLTT